MLPQFDDIISHAATTLPTGEVLGASREGRDVVGYRIGHGECKVSLLGGCHADEPVGPRFLNHLVSYLQTRAAGDPLLTDFEWWVVPHINPDGAERNRPWADAANGKFDVVDYLLHAVRELPGDDIEFGFPRNEADSGARPENRAVCAWWRRDERPFALHMSLHGMAFAAGPWFLIDPAWVERGESLMMKCVDASIGLGYRLHDVQRYGEKGFVRIERGFATRPNSKAMASFFIEKGDRHTAALFRPSSMEAIRSLASDALTLVSEMPLFVLPGVGEQIAPTDPVAEVWRLRVDQWRQHLAVGRSEHVRNEISLSALQSMPIDHQMRLQWTFIASGIEQSLAEREITTGE